MPSNRQSGSVKWFNPTKGYGYIGRENGRDVFVLYTALGDLDVLQPGQQVEFTLIDRSNGPEAVDVNVVVEPPARIRKTAPPPSQAAPAQPGDDDPDGGLGPDYEPRFGDKYLGQSVRDSDGSFGSLPLYDDYGDEAES